MKIYTVVKVEVKDGSDTINLLITTTDKGKAQKRFKREVTLEKTNPYWQNGNRELFDDIDDEYYCVYDINDHTLILLKETILKWQN